MKQADEDFTNLLIKNIFSFPFFFFFLFIKFDNFLLSAFDLEMKSTEILKYIRLSFGETYDQGDGEITKF